MSDGTVGPTTLGMGDYFDGASPIVPGETTPQRAYQLQGEAFGLYVRVDDPYLSRDTVYYMRVGEVPFGRPEDVWAFLVDGTVPPQKPMLLYNWHE